MRGFTLIEILVVFVIITILVSIVFFGGIQLLAISIIGKYIQVVVEETKSRPVYIVDKVISKIKQ